ncbi:MAG: helix-turn-helix domain-containing protein [Rickettsiales bacterium]|nr:helix-turn-helix domain-containing protein [Rickettsiales bacterium]
MNQNITETIRDAVADAIRDYGKNIQEKEYLNTVEAAHYLGFSKQRLEIWRCHGGGPRYIRCNGGSAIRYHKTELDAFMAANIRRHTADDGDDNV